MDFIKDFFYLQKHDSLIPMDESLSIPRRINASNYFERFMAVKKPIFSMNNAYGMMLSVLWGNKNGSVGASSKLAQYKIDGDAVFGWVLNPPLHLFGFVLIRTA